MIKLAKFLKPYILFIILAIALLYVQANAELALPDFMSDIVNVGIQQGGVENSVPVAVRESTMQKLEIFMSQDDIDEVLENFSYVDSNSENYSEIVEEFPISASEHIYVLGEIDSETSESLNEILTKPFVIVSFIEQVTANPEAFSDLGVEMPFDASMLAPGTDIFSFLSSLPAEQYAMISSGIETQFEAMNEMMLAQMASMAVKTEYDAIGMDEEQVQSDYIMSTGGRMLLISLLGGVCTISVGWLASKTAAGSARDLRKAVFAKIESFSNAEFNKFSTASLITRTTNDVTQVQMVTFMILRMVVYAPILGVGGVIRAIDKGAGMWWIIGVAVVALVSLIIIVFKIAVPKFQIMQDLVDRLNLVTRENLSGMMVIRAFNKQKVERERFDKSNVDLTETSLFVARVMVTMMPIMMFIMNALSIAIIWVGAHQVAQSNMQVGDMMAFLQYAMQIVMSFLMMSMMFIFLPRAAVSGARIAEVLDTEIEIKDPKKPKSFKSPFKGEIEFKKVSFKYPGAEDNILHDISFTARPGKTTAVIGSTGCGKSTAINLIPRFYDVSEGVITVDGIDVREVEQTILRDKIGYIPQSGTLFSGTIESNLKYADENATEETIKESIKIAQAEDFIYEKEEGLESEISQGGSNVSGGQKQRLAIARALVKKPPIYIFDDSFSALDFKTDSALRKALKEKTGDSTVLIVTQRVATIKYADHIIVLDEGRLVGKGNHKELMKECETYREIAQSQLSKEELA